MRSVSFNYMIKLLLIKMGKLNLKNDEKMDISFKLSFSPTTLCYLWNEFTRVHGCFGLKTELLIDFSSNGFHTEFEPNNESKPRSYLSSECDSGDESG